MRIFQFILVLLFISCGGKQPEPRKPISYNSGSYLKESAAKNRKLVKAEEQTILELIKQDTLAAYKNSEDGFWYSFKENQQKNGVFPQKGDLVIFEYDLLQLNGDTIYTKEEIGEREYYIDEERLFSGMRQGLKLMQEGDEATFLFPSYKAFGYYGDQDRIGSNIAIKSNVTLKMIKPKQKL